MKPLAGELIAYPTPNRPGHWAYRKLDDGTVLETELTQDEWHALHDAWSALQARIERAIQNCVLPMARDEIADMHRMLNSQAQNDGGVFCFKNEYVAAWKTFSTEPNAANARALLTIAPMLIEYFEGCAPGGRLYTGNTPQK